MIQKNLSVLFSIILYIHCSSIDYKLKYKDASIQSSLEKLVLEQIKAYSLKGISIAIVKPNQTIFSEGYGTASEKNQIAVTEDTAFKIGSISKVFTALLVMKLVEDGKLSLDKSIDTYIKEFSIHKKSNYNYPTIRQLLSHHGGMPGDILNGFEFSDSPPPMYDRKFLEIPTLLKNEHMSEMPGKVFAYSNISFGLLGVLVERLSGKTLNEYAEEKIFKPLNLKNTSYLDSNIQRISNGYILSKEIFPPKIRDLGAGSVSSTSSDMAIVMQMLLNMGSVGSKRIMKESSIQEMLKVQNHNSSYDGNFQIGLPFWLDSNSASSTLYTHGGDLPPFHAQIILDFDTKIGVYVATNTMSSSMNMKDICLKALLEYNPSSISTKSKNISTNTTDSVLRDWEGTYVNPSSILEISKVGNDLKTNLGPIYLEGMSDGSFLPKIKLFFGLLQVRINELRILEFRQFKTDSNEKYITLSIKNVPAITYLQYYPTPVLKSWRSRVGKYKLISNDKNKKIEYIFLSIKNNSLILEGQLTLLVLDVPLEYYLRTVSDSLAFIEGVGRNAGEAIQWKEISGEEILEFSGFKFKRDL
jgi:CubicO group peptidase (beta-lactamase class C family)